MEAVAVIFVYALFAIFEIISLKKTNQKKELIVYCILLSVACILSLLLVFDVKIPSPSVKFGDFIKSIIGE